MIVTTHSLKCDVCGKKDDFSYIRCGVECVGWREITGLHVLNGVKEEEWILLHSYNLLCGECFNAAQQQFKKELNGRYQSATAVNETVTGAGMDS